MRKKEQKKQMKTKTVQDIEHALEILDTLCIEWITTNKIENNLWVQGTAFFDSKYCRVAYYDERHNVLVIHR